MVTRGVQQRHLSINIHSQEIHLKTDMARRSEQTQRQYLLWIPEMTTSSDENDKRRIVGEQNQRSGERRKKTGGGNKKIANTMTLSRRPRLLLPSRKLAASAQMVVLRIKRIVDTMPRDRRLLRLCRTKMDRQRVRCRLGICKPLAQLQLLRGNKTDQVRKRNRVSTDQVPTLSNSLYRVLVQRRMALLPEIISSHSQGNPLDLETATNLSQVVDRTSSLSMSLPSSPQASQPWIRSKRLRWHSRKKIQTRRRRRKSE
jgi:hypothetical protein